MCNNWLHWSHTVTSSNQRISLSRLRFETLGLHWVYMISVASCNINSVSQLNAIYYALETHIIFQLQQAPSSLRIWANDLHSVLLVQCCQQSDTFWATMGSNGWTLRGIADSLTIDNCLARFGSEISSFMWFCTIEQCCQSSRLGHNMNKWIALKKHYNLVEHPTCLSRLGSDVLSRTLDSSMVSVASHRVTNYDHLIEKH